jgi:hypothetical protein
VLSYTIDTKHVGEDSETNEKIFAPYVVWGEGHVTVTANEAMEAESTGKQSKSSLSALETAKQFLSEKLAAGPVPKDDIMEEAEANGIAERTLGRAKGDLKITAQKIGFGEGSKWFWKLPAAGKQWTDDDQRGE